VDDDCSLQSHFPSGFVCTMINELIMYFPTRSISPSSSLVPVDKSEFLFFLAQASLFFIVHLA